MEITEGSNAGRDLHALRRATKIKGTPAEFMDKDTYGATGMDRSSITRPDSDVAVSLQGQMGVTVRSRLPSVWWRSIDPVDAVFIIVDRHGPF
jgi:hypothetical protein